MKDVWESTHIEVNDNTGRTFANAIANKGTPEVVSSFSLVNHIMFYRSIFCSKIGYQKYRMSLYSVLADDDIRTCNVCGKIYVLICG